MWIIATYNGDFSKYMTFIFISECHLTDKHGLDMGTVYSSDLQ